jgi:Tfp pilus assembly protein PilF
VIDPGVAARLRTLAKTRPGDHLLLAVEYARAGVVDDARSELEAELGANPSRGDVRALLHSLDGRR